MGDRSELSEKRASLFRTGPHVTSTERESSVVFGDEDGDQRSEIVCGRRGKVRLAERDEAGVDELPVARELALPVTPEKGQDRARFGDKDPPRNGNASLRGRARFRGRLESGRNG